MKKYCLGLPQSSERAITEEERRRILDAFTKRYWQHTCLITLIVGALVVGLWCLLSNTGELKSDIPGYQAILSCLFLFVLILNLGSWTKTYDNYSKLKQAIKEDRVEVFGDDACVEILSTSGLILNIAGRPANLHSSSVILQLREGSLPAVTDQSERPFATYEHKELTLIKNMSFNGSRSSLIWPFMTAMYLFQAYNAGFYTTCVVLSLIVLGTTVHAMAIIRAYFESRKLESDLECGKVLVEKDSAGNEIELLIHTRKVWKQNELPAPWRYGL